MAMKTGWEVHMGGVAIVLQLAFVMLHKDPEANLDTNVTYRLAALTT